MNYVKMITVSALLLAVPAANAGLTDALTAPVKWVGKQFTNEKHGKAVKFGTAFAGSAALAGLYFGVKPFQRKVNALVSAGTNKAKKVSRKGLIISATTATGLTLAGLATWWLYSKGIRPFGAGSGPSKVYDPYENA